MSLIKKPFLPLKRFLQHKWKSFRFNLSSGNNKFFLFYYRHLFKPERGSLSEFLNEYSLAHQEDFTVIQIGANDGITHDPIHKFIKRDNWNGVLLEPQPDVFNQYLKRLYAKNKGIKCVCAAIGEEDGSQLLYKIGFSDMRWATGLASFSRQKIEKTFEDGIVASNCERSGIDIPKNKSEWISHEAVEVISPATLISRYEIKKINLLQIDAEGYDLEVIRIFDIGKTQPQAIVFENVGLQNDEYEAGISNLHNYGYSTRKFGPNTLAMKQPSGSFNKFFLS
ncbi:MAG: FkbM family methyltransferase [Bacteroidales bacterium]